MTLTSEEWLQWKRNSYLKFSGLFGDRIQDMSNWLDEVLSWPVEPTKWLTFFEHGNVSVMSRIENVVPFHKGIDSVLNDESLLHIVSELLGEPALLYKDRINYKPPSGGPHEAHQDSVAYDDLGEQTNQTASYISALICVDDASRDNGGFEVADTWPSDRADVLPMEFPDASRPTYSRIASESEARIAWREVECQPGDVVVFTANLPHRSSANTSSRSRRILYGVYNPVRCGDLRELYFEQKRRNMYAPRYMVGNPHAVHRRG